MSAMGSKALLGGGAAALPADDQTDNGEMDEAGDQAEPMDEPVEDDNSPIVLCTIMDNRDGTFSLVKGDEGDSGEDDGMSGEAAEGMPPAAGGVAKQPEGESFDSPGPLLKAVLDILKDAEERAGGSADANMEAGFNGPQEAKPKAY